MIGRFSSDVARKVKGAFLPQRCAVQLLDCGATLRVQALPVGAAKCPAITIDMTRWGQRLEEAVALYRGQLEAEGYLAAQS